MWLFLSISQIPIGQLWQRLPGKVSSSVHGAAKHAWAKAKRSFLREPGNLTTWTGTILSLCYRHVDTSPFWHLLSFPENGLVFYSVSFLFCWVLLGLYLGSSSVPAQKATYRSLLVGWPLRTATGQWQCDLHYSNSSLRRAVISMPGKLMSLCCRLRLGMAVSRLPARGSHGGKWILGLSAAREGRALPRADGIFVFTGFANGSLPSLVSTISFCVFAALSFSGYWNLC